jgi:hypothetical protein
VQPLESNDRLLSSHTRDASGPARPLPRLLAAVAGFALLCGTLAAATPALADDEAATDLVAATPTISEPADGAFIGSNASFTVHGTKAAGSSIRVSGDVDCSAGPDEKTVWSCTVHGLPNGAGHTITATETKPETIEATPSPSPSPSPALAAETTITVDVLGPPTLNGGDALITSGTISGIAVPGAGVVASVDGMSDPGCVSKASDSGYWSCSLAVPSGTYRVSAQQSKIGIGEPGDLSDASASRTVTVDKVRPAAPVVISPRAGSRVTSQPVRYSGSGEAGGWVDVYVDGRIVCSTSVTRGSWKCSAGGIRDGSHVVRAIQRDVAGNFSAPSKRITVFYGKKATPPAVAPIVPRATPTPKPTPTGTPSAVPTPSNAPVAPGPEPPRSAPPTPPAASNWGTPTGFGSTLSPPAQWLSGGNWLFVLLVVGLFIALVALPLRLLATASRGRWPVLPQLFARNRAPSQIAAAPRSTAWLTGAGALAGAVGLIIMATGISAEVRYLRLTAAVAVALAVLNAVVAATTRLVSRRSGAGGRFKVVPLLLFAAALIAVLSRIGELEPPLVMGVIIGMGFVAGTAVRDRAVVGLAGLAAVAVLSVAAWLLHSWLGPVEGFWASFASESLAALCLAGLGSLVVLGLPIASLPGRAIFQWSVPVWLATVAVGLTLASCVALGDGVVHFPAMAWLLAASAFAAVSVASWAWFRFVDA